jgi:hypothetical protein
MRYTGLAGRASMAAVLVVAGLFLGADVSHAASKGAGTMLVRQDIHCAGTGTASTVYLPFALYFTGYPPHTVGTVSAYTQPGGHLVASREITLDASGARCVEVVGSATPGQYKIVYDFGSGAGKQKVIRVVPDPSVTATASPSHPIATVSPTRTTPAPTSPTASVAPSTTSAGPTVSGGPTTSAPTTSAPPTLTTSPTGTASGGSGASPSTSSAPAPSESETADLTFVPEYLPPTGGSVTSTLPAALVLLCLGAAMVLLSGRGRASSGARRH